MIQTRFVFYLFNRNIQDVTIAGYKLPKGTDVMPQISSVLHDETLFPNAKQFRPERFLEAEGH